jgi:hypothetical protein
MKQVHRQRFFCLGFVEQALALPGVLSDVWSRKESTMTNENNFTASFVCNREVRRVPLGWQHPRDKNGAYVPLHESGYLQRMSEGERAEITGHWHGRDLLMPEAGHRAEIAAYETTSEGTPISPAFSDTPEGRLQLVNYCAQHATTFGNNRADPETWAAILFGEGAVVTDDGRVEFR